MERRNFLKLMVAVIVCPKGLLADKKKPWAEFHKNCTLSGIEKQNLIKKFREAFKNTKFKSPLHPFIYYNGVRIFYREDLYA